MLTYCNCTVLDIHSLPKECDKAAKILQGFLADPDHPDTALNAIPKAVLKQAKGLAIFSVVKAVSKSHSHTPRPWQARKH